MSAVPYDTRAPKRPLNLSLNEDLVAKARKLTDNLSAEVESFLADFVRTREEARKAESDALKAAAEDWKKFTEQHGSLADEFSPL